MLIKRFCIVRLFSGVVFLVLFCGLPLRLSSSAVQDPAFDRLTEPDRKAFSERFEVEIWPLMVRNGKEGCVGCHLPRHSSTLRLKGEPDEDFRMMLREGFFLPGDPGSVHYRVSSRDKRRRMPPDDRPGWTTAEIQLLHTFVTDLDKKQQR